RPCRRRGPGAAGARRVHGRSLLAQQPAGGCSADSICAMGELCVFPGVVGMAEKPEPSLTRVAAARLSTEQLAQYHRDGFVCPVPVMPAAEARRLRKQLEAYEATQGGKLQAAQRSRAFLLFKWLDDLIRDPRVLDPIEQVIGPDILCWSTIFWIKDAGSKSFVSWHQDNTYWGLSSRNVVTAWFAISDASVEAGC